jgi:hypothetical protein
VYQLPYFKVRIGNFISKTDAEDFKSKLLRLYPQHAYIVEDIIEYTSKNEDAALSD